MTAISASEEQARCPERYPGRLCPAGTVVFGKGNLE